MSSLFGSVPAWDMSVRTRKLQEKNVCRDGTGVMHRHGVTGPSPLWNSVSKSGGNCLEFGFNRNKNLRVQSCSRTSTDQEGTVHLRRSPGPDLRPHNHVNPTT